MIEVRETDEFSEWFGALKDARARAQILLRIARLARRNPHDIAPAGDNVSELKIRHGAGYRVYYVQRGASYALLLAGGDTSTRDKDIARAQRLLGEYEE